MIETAAISMQDISLVLPEIILALGAMGLLMLGLGEREKQAELIWWLAAGLIAIAAFFVARDGGVTQIAFGGGFVSDAFARIMKLMMLTGAGVTLLMSIDYMRDAKLLRMEFPVLVLLATAGMMLMISANDLIALYVGLELQSLALYVIAAFRRDDVRSSEAGLKYFVLGALSSGLLLYGASLIYGFTGATTFPLIAEALTGGQPSIGVVFGLVFVFAGLAFKLSAVPFHMWTPDVYEGAPTPVTAFFAAAPKIAAMALTVRFAVDAFPLATEQWRQIVVFISIASMVLGSFAAIGQTNIKRLMAYSSIGHVGFALIGLAAANEEGIQGVVVYLVIYLAMTLGMFAFILSMRRAGEMVEDIDSLSGLSQRSPMQAFILAALLFSLAGIPPLAGFFAKFYVFTAAIKAELYGLSVIGVVASVVGAYYYLRIVKIMYFDQPAERFDIMPFTLKLVFGVSGIVNLFFWLFPAPFIAAAQAAARSLL